MESINTSQQRSVAMQIKGNTRDPEEFLATQKDKLRTLAESFESLLTNEIFKSMRKISFSSDDEEGLFKTTQEEKIFTSMLDAEIADMASHKNPYGLSEMVYKSLEPTLEGWHENRTNQLKAAGRIAESSTATGSTATGSTATNRTATNGTVTNGDNTNKLPKENILGEENKLNQGMLTEQFLGLSNTIQGIKSQNFNDKALDNKVY